MAGWRFPRRRFFGLAGAGAGLIAAGGAARANEEGSTPGPHPASVWKPFFHGQRIWGYAGRESVRAGDPFDIMLAAGPGEPDRKVRVELSRIGAGAPSIVWRSAPVTVGQRAVPRGAAATGCGWPAILPGVNTTGWPPGCYSADVVEEGSGMRDPQTFQIIVRPPRARGDILVRLGVNTYQAYNEWGGHSFYPTDDDAARGLAVSHDRPMGPGFFEYDVWLVRWLEAFAAERGLAVDYASNHDVHADLGLLDRYRLVLCSAHDEYWSREEFDAFEHRIRRTRRATGFLGANTAYFQVRYADLDAPPDGAPRGRVLVCHKRLDDPIRHRPSRIPADQLVTARFREAGRRPEARLTAVAYQNYFDAYGAQHPPYRVVDAEGPLFEGVDWRAGDPIGPLVGYEWDNLAVTPGAASQAGLRDIRVLFRGEAAGADGQPGTAEAVTFRGPAGAKVFSSGTVRWVWGLGKPGFESDAFRRFNQNLLLFLLDAS